MNELNSNNSTPSLPPNKKSAFLTFFFGGLVPIILFTIIEEKYGLKEALIASIVFGIGEILFEIIKYRSVSTLTWISNGLIVGLGIISFLLTDGIWFKLQPAIIEFLFFIFLSISVVLKKPFLKIMLEKQNPQLPKIILEKMMGLTLRMSFFFLGHAILATYAAFYWTTTQWSLLKGLGLTISLVIYMVIEILYLRSKLRYKLLPNPAPEEK